jgi:excisionase family DNA binding protein
MAGSEEQGVDLAQLVDFHEEYMETYPIKRAREVYSIKEVADILRVHPNTIRRWVQEKYIDAKQKSGKHGIIYITRQELEKHIKGRELPKPSLVLRDLEDVKCVYVIRFREFFKIGCTQNIRNRLAEISIGLPEEPEIFTIIQCDDHFKVEKQLHNAFANKRVRGEWFALDSSDLKLILEFRNDMEKWIIKNHYDNCDTRLIDF